MLRNRGLRRLGLGYAISLTSLWMYFVAVSVFAYGVGGATLVGLVIALNLGPAAVGAPFVAVLVDRYPRRVVLVVTDAIRALLAALAAGGILLDLPAGCVFAIGALLVLATSAFEPAKNALVPSLADSPEQLTAANSLNSTIESASIFLGPALGGIVLAATGVGEALAASSVMFLVSTLLIARIRGEAAPSGVDQRDQGDAPGWRSELTAGLAAIRADRDLRLLIGLLGAQTFVDGALTVLIVSSAFDLFDLGDSGVGWLNAVVGIGGLIGGALMLRASEASLARRLGWGLVAWGVPIALIGAAPQVVIAFVLLGVVGIGNAFVDVSVITLLQRLAPERVLGRVLGAMEGLVYASVALGALTAPLVIEVAGTKGALIATGCLLPALALLAAPRLRALGLATDPLRQHRLDLLEGQGLFAPLGRATVEALMTDLRPTSFSAGDEVITQGERGDRFYLIDSGRVEVLEDGVRVREEGPGDHFGEIALIRQIPRTATVRALTDLELLALDGERFVAAVSGHARSAAEAEAVIAARLGSARRKVASL